MTWRAVRATGGAVLLALSVLGCGAPATRYDVAELDRRLAEGRAGLTLGDFPLRRVVDGDTVVVGGLSGSLRLLGLDTEETFKSRRDRVAASAGFDDYLEHKAGRTDRPVKVATPLGEAAKRFARRFFDGVDEVRLERDHPAELRDFYGRHLVYVLVRREGRWLHYNVEAVRAGMSPYFTKYGRSRRFHHDFEQAEQEARRAKRGIWDPTLPHYRDYPARLRWWHARAEHIARFERESEGRDDHVALGRWDSLRRLRAKLGEPVTVLGQVGRVLRVPGGPGILLLSRTRTDSLAVVFPDPFVLVDSGVERAKGEPVVVRGEVVERVGRDGEPRLQLVVTSAAAVRLPAGAVPGSGAPETPAPATDSLRDFYAPVPAAEGTPAPPSQPTEPPP